MKIKILITLQVLLVSYKCCLGQSIATDRAVAGQLKRMVYEQWNDWKPDPGTHFFGTIPNNIYGYVWWRWIYPSYYRGEDRRPYRTNGPFVQNIASLHLQNGDDAQIQDSAEAIKQTHIATLTNMSGGVLDTPYELYFKKKFKQLTTVELNYIDQLSTKNPVAYDRIIHSKVYQSYLETLDVQTSRIEANHQAFVEKGARIMAYLEIKKQLEWANKVIDNYMVTYIKSTLLPDIKSLPAKPSGHYHNNDAQIVADIMKTYQF